MLRYRQVCFRGVSRRCRSSRHDDSFSRFCGAGDLAGAATITFLWVDLRCERVFSLGKDVANRIVGTPSFAGRAIPIVAQKAQVHVHASKAYVGFGFFFKGESRDGSAWAYLGTPNAIFLAIVLLEIQNWGEQSRQSVWVGVALDDPVGAGSNAIATTGAKSGKLGFIQGAGRAKVR